MADIYFEYLPETGNPIFDLAAKRLVDLLRTYISEHDTTVDEHDSSLTTLEAAVTYTEVSSFSNSWVNYGGDYETAGYAKDAHGRVFLKGLIKSGTLTTTCFRLPEGMRPTKDKTFVVSSYGAFGNCYIDADGYVIPNAGDNRSFSLDGISFHAG